jgi:heptosyltransferase-3
VNRRFLFRVSRRLQWELGKGRQRRWHRIAARVHALAHRARLAREKRRLASSGRKLIVIALVEHMGDIVAAEPISRYVRKQNPDAYIYWCVRKPYRELIEGNPNIDAALVVDCLTEWIHLSRTELFDEIIDLHFEGRDCPTCFIPLHKFSGNRNVSYKNYFHHGSLLEVYCLSGGIPVLSEAPRVYIPETKVKRIDGYDLPERFIAVHCRSNEAVKDWPAVKWVELLGRIRKHFDVDIIEVGVASALAGRLEESSYIDLCGRPSILETAEVIRRSQVFIGIDSGPAHLANALGTFGVVLLGAWLDFERYQPYSGSYADESGAVLIHSKGLTAEIPVEDVYQVVAPVMQRAGLGGAKRGSGRLHRSDEKARARGEIE